MKEKMCDTPALTECGEGKLGEGHEGVCIVAAARDLLEAARRESCGACVFCREGTIQLHEILKDGTEGRAEPDDLDLLGELSAMVRDYAECDMAREAAKVLARLLEESPSQFEAHFKRGRCEALVCRAYYSVHVLPELCTGCAACLAVCPRGAIAGAEGLIHVINQELCDRCGLCLELCAGLSGAIAKAGAVKPQTPTEPMAAGSWGGEAGGRRRRRRGSDNSDGRAEE